MVSLCRQFQRQSKGSSKYVPAGIYLLKVNNRNTRTRCEICSKLTIKTPERRQALEHVITDFEHVIADWGVPKNSEKLI